MEDPSDRAEPVEMVEPVEPVDEGGEAPCYAHLLDEPCDAEPDRGMDGKPGAPDTLPTNKEEGE